jgi:hypothetical protein
LRKTFDPSDAILSTWTEGYRQANDSRWAAIELRAAGKPVTAELSVPPAARGRSIVRVYVAGREDCASSATDVTVLAPAQRAGEGSPAN